jgi:hypothetical protein
MPAISTPGAEAGGWRVQGRLGDIGRLSQLSPPPQKTVLSNNS